MMRLRYLLFPPHSTSSPIVGMRNMNIMEHRDVELILSFFEIKSQFSFSSMEKYHIEMRKRKSTKLLHLWLGKNRVPQSKELQFMHIVFGKKRI